MRTASLLVALGMWLLSTITVDSSLAVISLYMAVLGVGLGGQMQILTLIVQNEFPHRIVDTATAANNYFRQAGASLNSAIVGSYNEALVPIFAFMVPLGVIAALLLAFVKETPLATEIAHEIPAESLAEGQLLLTEFDEDDQNDMATAPRG